MTDKPTPIRNRRVKSLGFYRQPDTEFVTPRLNKERGFIQAVGFTARGDYDCCDDEDLSGPTGYNTLVRRSWANKQDK